MQSARWVADSIIWVSCRQHCHLNICLFGLSFTNTIRSKSKYQLMARWVADAIVWVSCVSGNVYLLHLFGGTRRDNLICKLKVWVSCVLFHPLVFVFVFHNKCERNQRDELQTQYCRCQRQCFHFRSIRNRFDSLKR